MKKIALVFLLIFSLSFVCAACGEDPEPVTHVVRFDVSRLSYETSLPEAAEVSDGETVSAPNLTDGAPTGYETIWTTDPQTGTPYDFSQAIKADLTLYAIETPKTYEIQYLIEPGRGENSAYNTTSYTMADEITVRDPISIPFGYHFVKWCYFDDLESDVTKIERGTQGKIVLRAIIKPNEWTVIYSDLNGAANPNPTKYVYGTELILEAPTLNGYIFTGFTAHKVSSLEVTGLTGEFVTEHRQELFNSNYIYLRANWEAKE